MYFTLMKNCNMDEWDRTIDTNIKGVTNGFGAVLPLFLSRSNGHIITISSDAGRRVFPSLAVYCASKTFVEVLSEGTRREVVGTGVKITTIQPGDVGGTEVRKGGGEGERGGKRRGTTNRTRI
jgi:NADP-dependent 3-hydroxy acid dehydrogenase YdfG